MKNKKRKEKEKHTQVGYFFFKVSDYQKIDNSKQQSKPSILGALLFK